MVETIERGAFARYLASGEDVKVLWNHDSNIVLGATGNGTASLREDEVGLFGSVEINENDQEAVNAYARVARGDVDGCSFGFDIARQEEDYRGRSALRGFTLYFPGVQGYEHFRKE